MRTTIIKISLFVFLITLISSCENQKKETGVLGLWLVEKVEVGENSMTPISKWTRFNSDSTQTSGNGWLQHSSGNWSLKDNRLEVTDKNGIIDSAEPFTIEVKENTMTWKRNEEGQEVIVYLKRINELPQSEGNKLIGLWKLTKAVDNGNDITVMVNPNGKSMMNLRWDNMYVQYNMPKGKQFGVYKIHGHKPEIQLVNYGNESKFSFWNFIIDGKKLTLTSTDQKSVMEFERIHQFIN